MPSIRIATEADLRRFVPLDAGAVDCVAEAFRALAAGRVRMPPILRLDIPEARGEVDVKTAWIADLPSFAIKISPGFFDNPALGLPSLNGLMTLFSARTGLLEAVLLDNGHLTDIRTAAAGAVAARALARRDARRAAILGAGAQAALQLEALTLVRPIEAATLWARDAARGRAAAARLNARLSLPVTFEADIGRAVAQADIVVTTTPAETPILRAEHLRPGQHVTAMGSDAEHKCEIDPKSLALPGLLYVADNLAQTRRLGELRAAIAAALVAPEVAFPELGAVIAGDAPGRASDDQITLCDLTGTGAQDTAIATLAMRRLMQAGAGAPFET